MFEYTPKKQILRDLQVSKYNRNVDAEYAIAQQILQKFRLPLNVTWILRKYFKQVKFRSFAPVQRVPVNGFLFPSSMFDEKII